MVYWGNSPYETRPQGIMGVVLIKTNIQCKPWRIQLPWFPAGASHRENWPYSHMVKFSFCIQNYDRLLPALSYLWFDVRFKVRSKTAKCKLCGVPQLVAEMTITLYTEYVKIDVTSCRTSREDYTNMSALKKRLKSTQSSNVLKNNDYNLQKPST